MEEAPKILKIGPKMLARRSNAMCDIVLANEQEGKQLVGSILMSNAVRLRTEYMGTHKKNL